MRARTVAALLSVVVTACGSEPAPPVVEASEVQTTTSPSADPDEARLAELRATDAFDEFAEHQRAAKADGARLAWENFAPIVDGRRVEWTNKAELWDSIAPEIRDEALLLGPEYREPLWDNSTAVPNSAAVPWINADTGKGDYIELLATYSAQAGPVEQVWGFLVSTDAAGNGRVVAAMPPLNFEANAFSDLAARAAELRERSWAWIESQELS